MMTEAQLISRFANEDKSLRHAIDRVLEVFDHFKVFKSSPTKGHFIEISREIYNQVRTEAELAAMSAALWWCYESALEENPNLLPPRQTMRLISPEPFINESNGRIGEIAAVFAYYEPQLTHCDVTTQLVAIALLLAKQAALTLVEQLLCHDEIKVIHDADRAVIQHDNSYIMFDAFGLLLWRRMKEAQCTAAQLRSCYASRYSHAFGSLRTLDDAFAAASLLQQPIFGHELNHLSSPIVAKDLISHLAGQPCNDSEATSIPSNKLKRRVFFDVQEHIKTAQSLAFGVSDSNVISELSLCLRRFKQQSPNEHRNSRFFIDCKTALDVVLQKSKRCSALCAVLIHYCISLFRHGSAWKARLAVNTVLTYLSTLQQFCVCVLQDEILLQQAQSDNQALTQLTDLVEHHLVTLAPDKQNTVLIFLQFICEHTQLRLVDECLDVFSAKAANTRTHYLSPQLFQRVIAALPKVSIRYFLFACYFLGLRHDEAISLIIDDVTDEFIYVTRRSKRKSQAAVRRISLMFMPSDVRQEFLEFVATRQQQSTHIFDVREIRFYLPNALIELRKHAGNNQFVLHSLRHCAANNMLFMLCIATFERSDWRRRYALFQHELFSEATVSKLKKQCLSIGHPLLPQSPLLNMLACQLGHASPVVTAACYLHFLPFLSFELHALRGKAPHRDVLAALLAANSYRYELLKEQSFDEAKWFKHACRGLPKSTVRNKVDTHFEVKQTSLIAYVTALQQFLTTDKQSEIFQRSEDIPPVNGKTLTHMLSQTNTLRRLEFVSQQRWTNKAARALRTLQELLINDLQIHDIRTLRQVLFALNYLGIYKLEASLHAANCEMQRWRDVANRFDCTLQVEVRKIHRPLLAISSIKSDQKHIRHLYEFTQLICFYNHHRGVLND